MCEDLKVDIEFLGLTTAHIPHKNMQFSFWHTTNSPTGESVKPYSIQVSNISRVSGKQCCQLHRCTCTLSRPGTFGRSSFP